jgi:hypothetical protein
MARAKAAAKHLFRLCIATSVMDKKCAKDEEEWKQGGREGLRRLKKEKEETKIFRP